MKTIGFPISHKENEFRRALVPEDIKNIYHPEYLKFEKGYGAVLGIDDSDYEACGVTIESRENIFAADIICDPKIGDADYLETLPQGKTLFGWIHATQNRDITDKIVNNHCTAIAWEKMNYKGQHIFWKNNELAGEAAIMHAYQCYGRMPYETKVAVIGRGNTARGCMKVLDMLGAHVMQYNRRTEKLLLEHLSEYDVIVNCVLWDVTRKDHIISRENLKNMKKGSMIIDVSCDRHGGIETSIPTTIENPTYVEGGIIHYVVDHTPSIFYKTFSYQNSCTLVPFINDLVEEKENTILSEATIICEGDIVDQEIVKFQHR